MNKIEGLTLHYWMISSARNNRPAGSNSLTTSEALHILVDCEEQLNPARSLALRVHELKFDIIEGNTKWRQPERVVESQTSNLIPLMIE